MRYGKLRKDDSDHWYLVPEDEIKNFQNIMDLIYLEFDWEKKEDLISLFIESFDMYRLSGGVESLRVVIEKPEESICEDCDVASPLCNKCIGA
jgi:hypothetical protein